MANLPKPRSRQDYYQHYLAGYGNFADLLPPNPDRSSNLDWYLYEQCKNRDSPVYPSKLSNGTLVPSINLLNPSTVVLNEAINSATGVISSYAGTIYRTDYIPVKGNTNYTFCKTLNISGAWLDINKNFVSGLTSNADKPTIQAPASAKYVVWNGDGTTPPNTTMVVEGNLYPAIFIPYAGRYKFDWLNSPYLQFEGLNIDCLGDSTTAGSGGTGSVVTSWVAYLSNLCGFKKARNYGQSGTYIAKKAGRTDSFVERYPSMSDDVHVILIMGGANDSMFGTPLGDMASTDEFTFYGALKSLLGGLKTKFPLCDIRFVTPLKLNHATWGSSFTANAVGLKQISYVNAIKEVCDYYSVPVLDMYAESDISPFNTAQAAAYMPDKVHYNAAGYAKIGRKIAIFLNSK